jgi:myotubularin-related protein 6/7/8
MYKRFDRSIHAKENLNDIISTMKDHTISLEDHVRLLEKVNF